MFQTVVDELDVFKNSKLYDDNVYYVIDGCVFSYKAKKGNTQEALSTVPSMYLKHTQITI